jgi:hypothetical protein
MEEDLVFAERRYSETEMLEVILGLFLPAGHRDEPRGPLFVFLALVFCLAVSVGLYLLGRET